MQKKRILIGVLVVGLLLAVVGSAFAKDTRNFRAHLSSGDEVAAVPIVSLAQGQAVFQLNEAGTELAYQLNAANVDNVTQAHIHMAPAGINGPVVVWLYPKAPPPTLIPGPFDGVLAEGIIIDTNLVGPLTGQPLSTLLALLESGGVYVNIHTSQYPGGEMRGQVH
jgi:CHRD domain-containing protein